MKTIARTMMLSLLLMGFCLAQDQAQEFPKLTDNAALQYWFAFYFMYEPPPGEVRPADASIWPRRLSELYPTYVSQIDLFFISKDKMPPDAEGKKIDGQSHFRYMPEVLRRKSKGGLSTMCVLQTRRDDYFAPVRGHVEGYADGHVEWKPRKPDEEMPDVARKAMSNARQILLALAIYRDDHKGNRPAKDRTPWDFVYDDLITGTVPAGEALKPGLVEVCEKNRQAVTEFLRKASEMARCDFGLDYSRGPLIPLPHLAKVRALARNGVAYGKLVEAQGKPREAAEAYCDVVAMGPRIAQDKTLISALVAYAVERIGGRAIRSLLAHDPPAEVCEYILARLAALPEPYVEIGPRVPLDAKLLKPSIFAAFGDDAQPTLTKEDREQLRKAFGLGDVGNMPEGEQAAKLKALLTTYYEEYLSRAEMAAEIMGEPYPTAAITLVEMEKELRDSANPLIKMLMPSIPRTLTEQAKAQTDLAATRILAAAALHKAKTGGFPEKLGDLTPYFPKGIPRDPMGDKAFSYRLDDNKPCLESAGAPPGVQGIRKEDCVFGFADILVKENTGGKWEGR